MNAEHQPVNRKVSRRSVTGAIWTAPVVVGLAATPAYAASPSKATITINPSALWGGVGQPVQGNFTVVLNSTVNGDQRTGSIGVTATLQWHVGGNWEDVGNVPLSPDPPVTKNLDGGYQTFDFASSAPALTKGQTYRVVVNVTVVQSDGATVTATGSFADYTVS